MMNQILKSLYVFLLLVISGCSNSDDGNGGDGGGLPPAQATYRVTFDANFTEETHPTDYPDNASFGTLVVVAHDATVDVFSIGQLASAGVKDIAENGNPDTLAQSFAVQEGQDAVLATIETGAGISATGSGSVDIIVTPTTANISFLSNIDPSPDWFVGLDTFFLVGDDGFLIDEATFELGPRDAGTQGGESYNSPPESTNEAISNISAEPFTFNGQFVNSLGTLTITRISENQ